MPLALLFAAAWTAFSSTQTPTPTVRIGSAWAPGGAARVLPALAELLTSEWLVMLGTDGRPAPRLAESWSRSPDGRVWTFRIPDKLVAHGDQPVDARTVAGLLRSTFKDPLHLQLHPEIRDIVGIDAVGTTEIIVRSKTSRALMLDVLADLTIKRDGTDGGFGPFEVVQLNAERLDLRAFPKYFRGMVGIPQVSFRSYSSGRAAWSALMRNEVDALYEVGRDAVEFIERDPRVRVYPFLRPYASTLLFNVAKPALARPEVRRALSHAIDRDAIVEVAYRRRGRSAEGPLWPEHWALAGVRPIARHDPLLATRMLARELPLMKAGPRMPARLHFKCLVAAGAEMHPYERIALLLQRQLFAYGIDMELEPVSVTELIRRIFAGDFDAALFEFLGRTPGWMYGFWHSQPPGSQGWLQTGYSGADAELQAMQNARDDQELKNAIAAVYSKFATDPPAAFLAWSEVTRAVSTDFVVPDQKGADAISANLWLWAPARPQAGGTR